MVNEVFNDKRISCPIRPVCLFYGVSEHEENFEMTSTAALLSLFATIAVFFVLWLISLRTRNAAIADVYWGPGFVVIASVTLMTNATTSTSQIAFAALVGLWGIRLGFHLWFRHRANPTEDRRYALMRQRGGKNWPLKSLFSVFMIQAVIQWLVALPIHLAMAPWAGSPPGMTGRLGIFVFAVGIMLETLADAALMRFKRKAENKGRLLTEGLFAWVRHPNYFGEALVWTGLALFSYGSSGAEIVFLSPVLITFLIIYVSGIPPLEAILCEREGFEAWKARTNAFVPWPPRRPG